MQPNYNLWNAIKTKQLCGEATLAGHPRCAGWGRHSTVLANDHIPEMPGRRGKHNTIPDTELIPVG